jgi:hypothetical protein
LSVFAFEGDSTMSRCDAMDFFWRVLVNSITGLDALRPAALRVY